MLGALNHCFKPVKGHLGPIHMYFCEALWDVLRNDSHQQDPDPGWNVFPTYGAVYLSHESYDKKRRSTTWGAHL